MQEVNTWNLFPIKVTLLQMTLQYFNVQFLEKLNICFPTLETISCNVSLKHFNKIRDMVKKVGKKLPINYWFFTSLWHLKFLHILTEEGTNSHSYSFHLCFPAWPYIFTVSKSHWKKSYVQLITITLSYAYDL